MYKYLEDFSAENQTLFPYKMIWKTPAPPRISFFAWEAAKERILTLDNLMKRGFHLANRCTLCKVSSETCRHLLLWCPITYGLWNDIFSLMGIQWVIAGSVKAELLAWEGIAALNKHYSLIPLSIFWVEWKERNKSFWVLKGILPTSRINGYISSVPLFWGTTLIVWMNLVSLYIFLLICKFTFCPWAAPPWLPHQYISYFSLKKRHIIRECVFTLNITMDDMIVVVYMFASRTSSLD